ncbi:MAG: UPF0149 family protein [Arenicellales bacterium]|jgi:uncharacterized protein YgfB (UPF0149 family)|nr:UPF0149 family protein [Arenicellales bacterium]MDP7155712.1 UPF0149 family protein [Arenicellales bacterium]MDP7283894.1 UPF0149 family protein [Arenicellales bacterium]MDP7481409.1 UPF0149 family protein [Arenicellales bacterium]MEE1540624.1 UPF0149 family protein [Arenicellales bacterium]|tara:strand:+ start:197 stop:733 length:537 start_codon:yes stop_codon:yes gene_type:complete
MTLDYTELNSQLQKLEIQASLAELHGMTSGLAASHPLSIPGNRWQSLVLEKGTEPSGATDERIVFLDLLLKYSMDALSDENFTFEPLLPADSCDLRERTDMLAQWCQGFTIGLFYNGFHDAGDLPQGAREAAGDIQAFVSAALDGEDESDEIAYTEIVEYLRVAVNLIFVELYPSQPN